MAIKNYLIIFFFILLILYIFFKDNVEHFKIKQYLENSNLEYNFLISKPKILYPYARKNITVEIPNKILKTPIEFLYNFNIDEEKYIYNKISKLFPLKPVNYSFKDNIKNKINVINEEKDKMILINEDVFLDAFAGRKKFKNNKKKNIRFINSFYYVHFTLITHLDNNIKSWEDIQNKSILTFDNSQSLYNLKVLISSLGYNDSVKVFTTKSEKNMENILLTKQVDAIYLTTAHPSPFIQKISRESKIKIISSKGLPLNQIKFNFPSIYKQKIDKRDYTKFPYLEPFVESLALRVLLITNKDTTKKDIYNLTKTIFSNISYIRGKNKVFNNLSPYFMIFAVPLLFHHNGTFEFLEEENYITTSRHNLCYFYTGANKCSLDLINRNRFVPNYSISNNYERNNYTILNDEGNWNNILNNSGTALSRDKIFLERSEYVTQPNIPLLLSGTGNERQIDKEGSNNIILKNIIRGFKVKNAANLNL